MFLNKVKILGLLIAFAAGLMACGPGKVPPVNSNTGYEIFVYSYCDSNGDGIGDFKGATSKLDYIKSLGIDLIWLMPIFKSQSYHGYDVMDYWNVSPELGTIDDFKEFCKGAHERGMRVILDVPMNHTSILHPWFQKSAEGDSKYRDYYVWQEKVDNRLWNAFYSGGPWNPRGNSFYYSIFWKDMPDLNYKNQAVRNEILDMSKMWLKSGADGFRIDGARYIVEDKPGWDQGQADSVGTLKWWKEFCAEMRDYKPGVVIVGEVWAPRTTFESYYINGKGFEHCFDFDFANSLIKSINQQKRKYLSLYLKEKRNAPWSYYSPFWGSHDINRSFETVGRDPEKAKLGFSILLSVPGTPFLYYGEEIGMVNAPAWEVKSADPDPPRRSGMAWDNTEFGGFTKGKAWKKMAPTEDPYNVAAQEKDPNSLLNHIRKFTKLRSQYDALRNGSVELISSKESSVGAFHRRGEKEGIVVMYNLSDKPVDAEVNFFGTTVPQDIKLENILEKGADISIAKDTYNKTKVSFKGLEYKMYRVPKVLAQSNVVAIVSEDMFRKMQIVCDNRANPKKQIFFFGTFDSLDGGAYKENVYGDVVEKGYKMFDDGKHGDGASGDNVWGIDLKLVKDFDDPYIIKFGLTGASTGDFLGSTELFVNEKTEPVTKYVVPSKITKQDVTLVFSIDMSKADAPSITEPGVRGTLTQKNKWNIHVPVNDLGKDGDKKAGDKIYTGKFVYPQGSPAYVEYKFNKNNGAGWESNRPNRTYVVDSTKAENEIKTGEWDKK